MKIGGRGPPVPDAELIRALAALLTETGLTEIEYAVGDRHIAASPCAICTQMVLRARRGREGPDGHRWGAPPNRVALDFAAGGRWIRTSGSAREALSRFDLRRRHHIRELARVSGSNSTAIRLFRSPTLPDEGCGGRQIPTRAVVAKPNFGGQA